MLYYLENAEMTECMTCGHSRYKPRTGRGKTLVAYKKLRYKKLDFPTDRKVWRDFRTFLVRISINYQRKLMPPTTINFRR